MVEKNVQKTKVQNDHLSDSYTPDEEVDLQLRTSEEERIYGMISTGYTGSVISYKGAEQSNGGKRPTTVTQNKEALQRSGS